MIIYLIIIITVLVSILSFNDHSLFERLKFNAFDIKHSKEGWRFFTYGFVHADWIHLLVNMFVFHSFANIVYTIYGYHFGFKAGFYFILLYVGGILFSTLWDFGKHKDNAFYSAVGASGAVSAVVFASILLYPQGEISLMFLPIPMPAAVFGLQSGPAIHVGTSVQHTASIRSFLATPRLCPQVSANKGVGPVRFHLSPRATSQAADERENNSG